jgi:hypothetical protein
VFAIVACDGGAVDDKLDFSGWEHWDKRMMAEIRVLVKVSRFMVGVDVHLCI